MKTNNNFPFRRLIAVNVKWVGLSQILAYFFNGAVWVILVRLLPPRDFGVLGIVTALSTFVLLLSELGLDSALVQRKNITEGHVRAAVWFCCLAGIVFSIMMAASASCINPLFRQGAAQMLLLLFAAKQIMDSLVIVHQALLARDLLFKKLTFIDIYSNIFFGLVSVSMALRHEGVLAIGWGYVAKSFVRWMLLRRSVRIPGGNGIPLVAEVKELLAYGSNVVGFRIVSGIAHNIDILIIGRILGSTALGYYTMALNLVNLPRNKISSAITQVVFPAFSRLQEHRDEMRNAYEKLIRYASVINFPLLCGLLMVAPRFVHVVYSSQWAAMVLPLQILCVYGMAFSLTTFVGILFNATGYPQLSLRISLISLTGVLLALAGGLPYGLLRFCAAMAVFAVCINVVGHYLVNRLIALPFSSYFGAMFPAIVSSSIMMCVLSASGSIGQYLPGVPEVWLLAISIAWGALAYGITLYIVSKKTCGEIMAICKEMLY